jgi:hypothetical protein
MIHSSAFGRKPSISNSLDSTYPYILFDFDEFVMASILAKAVHNNICNAKELSENGLSQLIAQ